MAEVQNLLIINITNDHINLPTQQIRFEISGINTAIANAIRRVAYGELPIKRLACEPTDIITDDRYIVVFWPMKMLSNIIIDQKIPQDEKFTLFASNTSPAEMTITTDHIMNKHIYWQKSAPICSIKSPIVHKTLITKNNINFEIKNIKVRTLRGIDNGQHNQCSHASIQPVDVVPKTYGGPSSTESYPTHYYFKLLSNGGYEPKKLLCDTCDNLISRLRAIENDASKIKETDEGIYEFTTNENYTIMNLIYYELVMEIIPNVNFITFNEKSLYMTMRARDPNISKNVSRAVDSLIKKFTTLKQAFEKIKEKIVNCKTITERKKHSREHFKHLPLLNDPDSDIAGTPTEFNTLYIEI